MRVSRPPPTQHGRHDLRPVDAKATVSLSLGILSVTCLGALAGLPAMVVGALAHRQADKRGGETTSSFFGMLLGALGTAANVALIIGAFVYFSHAQADAQTQITASPSPPVRYELAPSTGTEKDSEITQPSPFVVQLGGNDHRGLRVQLAAAVRNAEARGKVAVVVTSTKRCKPCREFEAQLADPRMQLALHNVQLIRIDAEEFEDELAPLRMDADTVPWFFKLDSALRAKDGISAAEWDDNHAGSIAPVLRAFVDGKYGARKLPPPIGISL
jgi:hypothetical protein